MGQPTNIINAADVAQQASIAAVKMSDMLNNMETQLNPFSAAFYVPEVKDELYYANIDTNYGTPANFDAVKHTMDALATSYNVQLQAGERPNLPSIDAITNIDTPVPPALVATMPVINIPPAPVVNIPSLPVAPSMESIATPVAPTVAIPNVPELAAVTVPSISAISIPLFTHTFPDAPVDMLAPDGVLNYSEEVYNTGELTALRDILISDLQHGGWGVSHTDEEALFSREADRAARIGISAEDDIISSMAARGFLLPPGALVANMQRNQQITVDSVLKANQDISVQRAELIRKSRESVIQSSLALNQTMVANFSAVQQRLLDVAKSIVDFSIRAFAARVEEYNMRVKAYAAYAEAWNTQIRGQLSQLEAEKAQLQAEAEKVALNRAQIEAYTAQVQAVSLRINIYNTEMEAAKIRSDIERNKLAVYSTQVDAHRSEITAEVAKIQAFEAQVNAEGSRVELYRTQVGAYDAEVQATKLVSDMQVQKAQVDLDAQRTKLLAYEASIKGYTAELAAKEAAARVKISAADGASRLASAKADLVTGQAGLGVRAIDGVNTTNMQLAQLRTAQQRTFSDHNIALMKARVDNFTKPAEMWEKFYTSIGTLASAVDVEVKSV